MVPTEPAAITYDNVSDVLVEYIPDLEEAYQGELRWWGDQRPGPHVVYGDILNPHIDRLLRSDDEAKLRQVFEFVEMLAGNPDSRVQELVAVTICEHLGSDAERLGAARPFMGPLTERYSRDVEQFWGQGR